MLESKTETFLLIRQAIGIITEGVSMNLMYPFGDKSVKLVVTLLLRQ
jgi:hypothetical protein